MNTVYCPNCGAEKKIAIEGVDQEVGGVECKCIGCGEDFRIILVTEE